MKDHKQLTGVFVRTSVALVIGIMTATTQAQNANAKFQEALTAAQTKPTPKLGKNVDLSGIWTGPQQTFPVIRSADGSIHVVSAGGRPRPAPPGPRPPPPPPNDPPYKPEAAAKWKQMHDEVSRIDKVFYCGRVGVPRMGPPNQIVQREKDVILLYTTLSGDTFRVVPTDGRPFRKNVDPSFNGDAVGHWEGDALVIESRNFTTESWFGANAYYHSDSMTVTERLQRKGDVLFYDATVTDPELLLKPWSPATRTVLLSDQPLEEALPCMDIAGPELLEFGH